VRLKAFNASQAKFIACVQYMGSIDYIALCVESVYNEVEEQVLGRKHYNIYHCNCL